MNFVLISPHFPKNYELFPVRLREKGINTLGIADIPYDDLSDTLKASLTEYYRVDDLNDYDQVYRAVAYFAHRYGKIDRIESHNEYWLAQDARLRSDFNVFGFRAEQVNSFKTKSGMKAIYRQHNIPVAEGEVVTTAAEAQAFVNKVGYPVIAKPDMGVGASNTYKIDTDEQLQAFMTVLDNQTPYMMEEYIAGDLVTFDGLVDRDNNIVFSSTIYHSHVMLDVVSQDRDMYYYLPRHIPEDLRQMGETCIKAFDLRERFFHFEFFRRHNDGSLVALEINCRPPGGLTIDMYNYANDMDIFAEYASLVADNSFNADVQWPYFCLYVSRKNHVDYTHSIADIRARYDSNIMIMQTVPGVFGPIMGDLGIVLRTADEAELLEMIQFIQERDHSQ